MPGHFVMRLCRSSNGNFLCGATGLNDQIATTNRALNEFLCGHLNSASRRQCFDSIQFLTEPVQTAGRRGDIALSL